MPAQHFVFRCWFMQQFLCFVQFKGVKCDLSREIAGIYPSKQRVELQGEWHRSTCQFDRWKRRVLTVVVLDLRV